MKGAPLFKPRHPHNRTIGTIGTIGSGAFSYGGAGARHSVIKLFTAAVNGKSTIIGEHLRRGAPHFLRKLVVGALTHLLGGLSPPSG